VDLATIDIHREILDRNPSSIPGVDQPDATSRWHGKWAAPPTVNLICRNNRHGAFKDSRHPRATRTGCRDAALRRGFAARLTKKSFDSLQQAVAGQ